MTGTTDTTDYTVEGFIAHAPWTVARAYADTSPHEYTARRDVGDDAYFTWFAEQCLRRGYKAKFGGKHTYSYLEPGDGFRYWVMWGNGHGARVINRCPVGQPREPIGAEVTA